MLMVITLLSLLARVPLGFSFFRTCVPNTNFQLKGKICTCDALGRWSDTSCHTLDRRQSCQPGQIIWGNCSQCICQEDGQLLCTKSCTENATKDSPVLQTNHFEAAGPWCTPFKSYYVNCSLCVCPASGRTAEARCAIDTLCSLKALSESSISSRTVCIPSVIYLFPCLHCVCSDEGYFVPNNCVNICHKSQQVDTRRCISGTFYRKECNICRCPANIRSDEICTRNICERKTKFNSIRHLKNKISKCAPHKFTKPKCFYCMCNLEGKVNENECLELDCLKIHDFKYDVEKLTCSPGEMVPICMECFCPRNGLTDNKYCTKICSFQSKLAVLEKILKASITDIHLINTAVIKKSTADIHCDPNSLYLDRGRYCLCPETGNTNFKLCTSITQDVKKKSQASFTANTNTMDFNISCEPNTFVEFDCNTCYCNKNGSIDPKWCTNDDCHSKKDIQDNHKLYQRLTLTKSTETCNPGSISKEECNFCICSESGLAKNRACTKNDCSDFHDSIHDQKFLCEPLEYYVVDCNVCFCPKDGLKNLAKCTKDQCEKNVLRSDSCVPGDLLSVDCNICVCPPNGDINDKVCTNYSHCTAANSSWQSIFKLSQNLLSSQMANDSIRSLHLCFPGEEFVDGCKLCVCPDMGMREYASCSPMFCNDTTESDVEYQTFSNSSKSEDVPQKQIIETRREGESCLTYNLTDSSERKECTPGSMYIIRCRQCICPYMGNINHFCRPLPPNVHCEQAYPYMNYLPMGRRGNKDHNTKPNSTRLEKITVNHKHTKYSCSKPGQILDDCYICECKDHVIIEEHCFKSDAENCTNAVPTFLGHKIVTDE